MRTHVKFEERELITTPTATGMLDDIKVGECFIADDPNSIGGPHNWPVYQRTLTNCRCLEDGKSSSFEDFSHFKIRRLKHELCCHQ
jgi:hypothetical protein